MMRDAMDKAAEQALRAGQIIRRLRDFVARGESERRVESVKKLVEEASALALVGAKDQGVRVQVPVRPRSRPRAGRQGADPAGAAQPDPQRDRGDGRHASGASWSSSTAPADDDMVDDQRRRHRLGHRAGDCRAAVPALRHHQAPGHGRRPVDLAHHRRGAMAGRSGPSPIRAAARFFASRCAP